VAEVGGNAEGGLARCQHFGNGLERVGVGDFDVFEPEAGPVSEKSRYGGFGLCYGLALA